jgi:hypothetical protein
MNKHNHLVQTLADQKDANLIKDSLRSIIEVLESHDEDFLKTQHSIVCAHIAAHILAPSFSSVISKHDVKTLILPILTTAPIQAIQSFINVILRIQNANVEESQRELIKNHMNVLIDVIDQVIQNDDLIPSAMQEMKTCNVPIEITTNLFSTLPERIYNAIITQVPDSSFGRIRSLIPRSFQPKYDNSLD